MDKTLLQLNADDQEHFKILITNAHYLAKAGRPFSDFAGLCDKNAANGLPIKGQYGNDCSSQDEEGYETNMKEC